MPHLSLKMLKGRTDEQKQAVTKKLQEVLLETLNCKETSISISIEDFTAQEWQKVFADEIQDNKNLTKKPQYDPKSMLK